MVKFRACVLVMCAILMVVASVMLYSAVSVIKMNILCLTSAAKWLAKNPPPAELNLNLPIDELQEAMPVIEAAEEYIVVLDAAVMAVGCVVAVVLLIASTLSFLGYRAYLRDGVAKYQGAAKCVLFIGIVLILGALVMHILLTALGVSMQVADVKEVVDSAVEPCNQMCATDAACWRVAQAADEHAR